MGVLVGAALAGFCSVFTALLLWRGLTLPVSLHAASLYAAAALFLGLGLLFAYWTYGCATLRYHLDRNGLTIQWGDIRQLIPMDRIQRLVPGRELPPPKITGVSWLGHHTGMAPVGELGDTIFYSTHRSHEEILYVVTPEQCYGISVPDEVRFAEELQAHQKMGPLLSLPQITERASLAALPVWRDPLALSLALAAAFGCAVTLGYVFYSYPGLQESIPFGFPSLGGITRVDDKREILSIPITGLGLLAVNLVLGFILHAWERAVGYLLFLAGLGAQMMLLAAAIITVNQ